MGTAPRLGRSEQSRVRLPSERPYARTTLRYVAAAPPDQLLVDSAHSRRGRLDEFAVWAEKGNRSSAEGIIHSRPVRFTADTSRDFVGYRLRERNWDCIANLGVFTRL